METRPVLWPRTILVLLIGACLVDSEFASQPTEDYPFSLVLSRDNYAVYWKHDKDSVILEVHGSTRGWVGIGFSPHGGMKVIC